MKPERKKPRKKDEIFDHDIDPRGGVFYLLDGPEGWTRAREDDLTPEERLQLALDASEET